MFSMSFEPNERSKRRMLALLVFVIGVGAGMLLERFT